MAELTEKLPREDRLQMMNDVKGPLLVSLGVDIESTSLCVGFPENVFYLQITIVYYMSLRPENQVSSGWQDQVRNESALCFRLTLFLVFQEFLRSGERLGFLSDTEFRTVSQEVALDPEARRAEKVCSPTRKFGSILLTTHDVLLIWSSL